jgi:NAD(P)-dependent dehydrogenase (short-subunit alcohol dehydrogenase family)
MTRLNGKVAIVLGAGRANIGLGIARRLAEAEATVVIAGRDAAAMAALGAETGLDAQRCDITSEADLTALAQGAVARHGRLDIAINAVGMSQFKKTLAVERAELEAITRVQFVGTFLFLQAVVRAMPQGGAILQISSASAIGLMHDHAAYMATKAAGDVLIRSIAYDYGPRGIRANSLSPGGTEDAPMAAHVMRDPAALAELRSRVPLGRVGTIRDVAEAALWLVSDDCFVSGENIQVSGGTAMHRLR